MKFLILCLIRMVGRGSHSNSSSSGVEEQLAQALEHIVAAMGRQNDLLAQMESSRATPARPDVPDEYRGLSEFRRGNPPQFTGVDGPEAADRWVEELEKIFRAM